MNENQALSAFSALSNETRLKVLRYLVTCGKAGQSAGVIGEAVGAAPSRASFHLAALEHAGLVSSVRRSRQIVYQADFKQLGTLVNFLLTDCCQNDPLVRSYCEMPDASNKPGCC